MNELLILILAWLAGGALGGIFFGGLWWTVRKGASSARPALWFFGSLMLRMSIALTGFYFVSGGNWQRALLCLLGFVMARVVVMRLTRPGSNQCGAGILPASVPPRQAGCPHHTQRLRLRTKKCMIASEENQDHPAKEASHAP